MNCFKYFKNISFFFIYFAVCLTVAGCGEGGGADLNSSSSSRTAVTLQSIEIALVGNNSSSTASIKSIKFFSDKALSNNSIYVPLGTRQNIAAYGIYSDNSVKNLTSQVKWRFANTNIANIVTLDWVVVPKSIGSSMVTATLGNVSGNISLNVTSAKLVSISVSPYPGMQESAPVSLPNYYYKASAFYDDNESSDISTAASWSSSSPNVATIDAYGLITPVSPGITKITASYNGLTASLIFTVTDAKLKSITISSTTSSLPLGVDEPFTATGTYTDGTHDVTSKVKWSSSDTSIANFASDVSNQLKPVATGTTKVTASLDGITSSPFTVNTVSALLTSVKLQIPPEINESEIVIGTCEPFKAIGTYSNGTTNVDISQLVSWLSSDTSVATVNVDKDPGKVCSVNDPSLVGKKFTITAMREAGLSDSATLTVVSDAITSITLSADQESGVVGVPIKFTATGISATGNVDVTSDMSWSINGNQIESNVYTPTESDVAKSQPAITVTATTTDSTLSNIPITNKTPTLSIYPKQIELWSDGYNSHKIFLLYPSSTRESIPLPITWSTDMYIFANYKEASHHTYLTSDSITITPGNSSMFDSFLGGICINGYSGCVYWASGPSVTAAGETTNITIQDNTDPNKFSVTYPVIVDDTKF